MSGVRQLRELSAKRSLGSVHGLQRHNSSSSDEDDDSKPLSPDKQLKVAAARAAGRTASCGTAAKPQQPQRRQGASSAPRAPRRPSQQATLTPSQPKAPEVVQREYPCQPAGAAAGSSAATPLRSSSASGSTHAQPLCRPAPPPAPATRRGGSRAAAGCPRQPQQQQQQQRQQVPKASSSSTDQSSISTESSCGSICDQMLLSAVIDSLHPEQHQQQLLRQRGQDSSSCGPPVTVDVTANGACDSPTATCAGANQLQSSGTRCQSTDSTTTSSSSSSSDSIKGGRIDSATSKRCCKDTGPSAVQTLGEPIAVRLQTVPGKSASMSSKLPQSESAGVVTQHPTRAQPLGCHLTSNVPANDGAAAAVAAAGLVAASGADGCVQLGKLQEPQQQQQQQSPQEQQVDLLAATQSGFSAQHGTSNNACAAAWKDGLAHAASSHSLVAGDARSTPTTARGAFKPGALPAPQNDCTEPDQAPGSCVVQSAQQAGDTAAAAGPQTRGSASTAYVASPAAAGSCPSDAPAQAAHGATEGLSSKSAGCGPQLVQQGSAVANSLLPLSAGGSLTASEFEAISKDVAARIIQTCWQAYRQRQQVQLHLQNNLSGGRLEQATQCELSLPPAVVPCSHNSCSLPAQHSRSDSISSGLQQQVAAPLVQHAQPALIQSQQDSVWDLHVQQQRQVRTGCTPTADGTAATGAAADPGVVAVVISPGEHGSSAEQQPAATAAAAFDKRRAAAGSRNTARLQHFKAGAGSVPPAQPRPPDSVAAKAAGSDADAARGLVVSKEAEAAANSAVCGQPQVSHSVSTSAPEPNGPPELAYGSNQMPTQLPMPPAQQQSMHDTCVHARTEPWLGSSMHDPSSTNQHCSNAHATAGANKLSTILAYLDAVEATVEQEATAPVAAAAAAPNAQGISLASFRPFTSCLPSARPTHPGSAVARPHTAQLSRSKHQHNQSLQLPGLPDIQFHEQQASQQQEQEHEQSRVLLWDGALLSQDDAPATQTPPSSTTRVGSATGVATGQLQSNASAAFSVTSGGANSNPAVSSRPAALAENVFESVKAKMRQLKAALADKESVVQAMAQEMEMLQAAHEQQLQQLAAGHQQQLSAVAADASATLSRHLGLFDKLMEEKQQLADKLEESHRRNAAAEEGHAAVVSSLKQGWAAELKRQAANWEAAAAAKQEAWRAAKLAEIKEQTVKGLEVEVQRLINRHRTELEAAHEKAADMVKQAVAAAKTEHDLQQQVLREKLKQQHDDVLDRERAAAVLRLNEAGEWWEAQLQATRMRLVAAYDMKLEAAAAATREEKRKGEAAVEAAEARWADKEGLLREEWDREKEAIARTHTRALEAAKQAAADERTAWRAAVTEQLKRQAAQREDKLRAELLKQRDEQLEVVIRRLESEGAAARAAAADKVAAEHAATMAALQEQLQQSQKGLKRLAERAKAAAAAAAAAERTKLELEQQLEKARQELLTREQGLAAASAALSAKESAAATAAASAAASAASSMQQLLGDKARLEGRLQEVQDQLRQQRQQHEVEMQHVELRVKAAISRKDEAIQQLQQQLAAAVDALRGTEDILAAQQEELCD